MSQLRHHSPLPSGYAQGTRSSLSNGLLWRVVSWQPRQVLKNVCVVWVLPRPFLFACGSLHGVDCCDCDPDLSPARPKMSAMDTAPLAPRAGVDWGAASGLNGDAETECGSASNPADDADEPAWGAAANAASDMSMKSMREMLSIALVPPFFAPSPRPRDVPWIVFKSTNNVA